MVKALHKAGIEVILDVVFNHTGEGNHEGPTISFKGLDNSIYYHLEPDDKQYYTNLSGCGNTFNCNLPLVEKFIVECLQYWVREMHVDGFRFDLALDPVARPGRRADGRSRRSSGTSSSTTAGRHQDHRRGLGRRRPVPGRLLPGLSLGGVERALSATTSGASSRATTGIVGEVASRIAGSADIYQARRRAADQQHQLHHRHDGFTLNDLVSYNGKHNEANGEGNRDGTDDNLSWNCGAEGDTDDPGSVDASRSPDQELPAILLLSQGVPMFVAGDEVAPTQHGNNNAYCQDNEITWFDWTLPSRTPTCSGSSSELIAFRRTHATLRRARSSPASVNERGTGRHRLARRSSSFSPAGTIPASRVLAFTLAGFPIARPASRATDRYPRDDEHGLERRRRSTSRR